MDCDAEKYPLGAAAEFEMTYLGDKLIVSIVYSGKTVDYPRYSRELKGEILIVPCSVLTSYLKNSLFHWNLQPSTLSLSSVVLKKWFQDTGENLPFPKFASPWEISRPFWDGRSVEIASSCHGMYPWGSRNALLRTTCAIMDSSQKSPRRASCRHMMMVC